MATKDYSQRRIKNHDCPSLNGVNQVSFDEDSTNGIP
jgi:hypothetical protein